MWECLLEITFERSQDKIDFGRVSGSILGGFGLHFGRFFGAKSEKVTLQSELTSKPKKNTLKSHAGIPEKSWVTGWSGPKRFRSRRSRRGDPGEAIQERRSRRGDPGEAIQER